MKRVIALLLALLLLCGCSSNADPTEPSAEPTTAPSSEPSTRPTTRPTTAPTDPDDSKVRYRSPLTGEPLDAPFSGRPVAITINNIKDCLPQYGISQADIFYEIETEGFITRCLAIFSDLESVEQIGPVRSSRTYFNNLAASYDAPLVHCGGSDGGITGAYDETMALISNWEHLDAMIYENSYFFRDRDRYKSGVAWEHCLFTTGELLTKGLTKRGYALTSDGDLDYGLKFASKPKLSGDKASKVVMTFYGGKTTTLTYDSKTGLYKAAQYGKDHIDAGNSEVMAYRNVLALYTSHWKDSQGYRSFYDLIGSGTGYFACDGKIVPIKWSRESLRDPFTYTLEDGTPVTLGIGSTYIGIASTRKTIQYE